MRYDRLRRFLEERGGQLQSSGFIPPSGKRKHKESKATATAALLGFPPIPPLTDYHAEMHQRLMGMFAVDSIDAMSYAFSEPRFNPEKHLLPTSQLEKIIAGIRYKSHIRWDLQSLTGPWLISDEPVLSMSMRVSERDTGRTIDVGQRIRIPNHARVSKEAFKMFLLEKTIDLEVHEIREQFKINDVRVDDPHETRSPTNDIDDFLNKLGRVYEEGMRELAVRFPNASRFVELPAWLKRRIG